MPILHEIEISPNLSTGFAGDIQFLSLIWIKSSQCRRRQPNGAALHPLRGNGVMPSPSKKPQCAWSSWSRCRQRSRVHARLVWPLLWPNKFTHLKHPAKTPLDLLTNLFPCGFSPILSEAIQGDWPVQVQLGWGFVSVFQNYDYFSSEWLIKDEIVSCFRVRPLPSIPDN